MLAALIKGDPVENAKERVIKIHRLIVKSIDNQEALKAVIEDTKQKRVMELVEAAEDDKAVTDTKKLSQISDAQRKLEEEIAVCDELVKRKALAIVKYYEEMERVRVAKECGLKVDWNARMAKIESVREELKKLGNEADVVHDQITACSRPIVLNCENRYINFENALNDPLFPADLRQLKELYRDAPPSIKNYESQAIVSFDENGKITESQYNC